jgi:hypothetical protein
MLLPLRDGVLPAAADMLVTAVCGSLKEEKRRIAEIEEE